MDDEQIELTQRELKGVDWGNDALFFTHEWEDETSQFDKHHSVRWNGGGEYYSRTYKARVPRAFENCAELADRFVSLMMDDFVDVAGFWVD